ncbi:Piwi domain-containing protein [Leeuwenhoekiella marinoflava]|uniref:Protein argonaute n=2 Tax=Leeuwenhoekiella marinoflava TaxID=988 RepID=A0A4Q0PKN4_9FLAO|nr:Piwi domain-containing protein [Leeuwenhoekiella marinoflava]RXG28445.1 argonaute-like protein [Leeuwenhoekiella marinoflava]SHF52026.1 Piwi domain-containing protein [Leeuwenhoekiella marinoflava DSM 3653]|tara:strand:- start:4929 stop:7220 length:2292 start_codon:yes stop_codon:yes gene_type:complete
MQLNYFPIQFDFSSYHIITKVYSDERLQELRKTHNASYSFFRDGNLIVMSNKEDEENQLTGKIERRSVYGDGKVTASLVKHLFFRTFKDRFQGFIPVDFYPFRFYSSQEKDDLILMYLPEKLKHKIAFKKLIEVQLRETNINNTKGLAFVVNIRRNWVFSISCLELHQEGFNLTDFEVLHTETLPGLDNVLAPNEDFVGSLQSINGNTAIVSTSEGEKSYPLQELFIRKTKRNIQAYLNFTIGEPKCNQILRAVSQERIKKQNPVHQFSEISNIAKHLFSDNGNPVLFQNKDGFCYKVDTTPVQVQNSMNLQTPTFIYDHARTKTNTKNADQGLSYYGPYDSLTFDIKKPRILSICHKANRGSFTNFLHNLKDGLPNSSWFKKGLLKKYELQEVNYHIREISDYRLEDYLGIIRNYDDQKPHLAIIEIPDRFKSLPDRENPYFKLKAKLLSLEIPVQFVRSTTISKYNEYILNPLALQIYAKLGGTPWVLPAQRSVDREIVIGIGHSWLRNGIYKGAESSRVVGITTFMSSDGQYLLGDKVKDVDYESYFEELLKSLKTSIERLSDEYAWQNGDTVRLIFHIFKPIKNVEFDVISQLVKDISQFHIKFAFVTISKSHPSVLFDASQQGEKKYGSNQLIGQFIPQRGSNIFIDDETSLVQMFGARELKTAKHGMSAPIQIKLRTPQGNHNDPELRDLMFYDLNYITQQIYSFTYLSWRSFLPREEPATMLYSNLISRLLGKMRSIPEWDADKLNYTLKRKKWFL